MADLLVLSDVISCSRTVHTQTHTFPCKMSTLDKDSISSAQTLPVFLFKKLLTITGKTKLPPTLGPFQGHSQCAMCSPVAHNGTLLKPTVKLQ